MTPDQFTTALESLHWKQSDFCRKTGTNKSTPSNWAIGKTPIPLWVDAYLGAMQDLAALHGKYLSTWKPARRTAPQDDDAAIDRPTGAADLDAMVVRVNATVKPPATN
jgi:hypothetical protein